MLCSGPFHTSVKAQLAVVSKRPSVGDAQAHRTAIAAVEQVVRQLNPSRPTSIDA